VVQATASPLTAYGLLLDASSRGWTRYGGTELRAAEERREQQRQARIAGLRQRFVDGPVFVMPCGGGTSNSLAVVIPGAGTVYGGSRRLPAPIRGHGSAIAGDGWTFKAAAGWVIREGARRGDYEVVQRQP
jgi:hypothetical protein